MYNPPTKIQEEEEEEEEVKKMKKKKKKISMKETRMSSSGIQRMEVMAEL